MFSNKPQSTARGKKPRTFISQKRAFANNKPTLAISDDQETENRGLKEMHRGEIYLKKDQWLQHKYEKK